jgi:hypothetical protein
VVPPIRRVNPSSHRRADPVEPFRTSPQWAAREVAELRVDGDDDWYALDQGVASLLVRGKSTLNPARIKQECEAPALSIPQLRFRRKKDGVKQLAVIRATDVNSASSPALAHGT